MKKKPANDFVRSTGLHFSWPATTAALATCLLAVTVTLIIVTAEQEAELLTILALVLAVVSFTAQLVVTGVQAHASNLQHNQMTAISDKTTITLNAIESKIATVQDLQKDHVAALVKMLQEVLPFSITAAVDRAAEEEEESGEGAVEGDASTPETGASTNSPESAATTNQHGSTNAEISLEDFSARVARNLERELSSALTSYGESSLHEKMRKRDAERNQLSSQSQARILKGLIDLNRLSDVAQKRFVSFADNISVGDRAARLGIIAEGPRGELPSWAYELSSAGLVRISSGNSEQNPEIRTTARLTQLGRKLVQVFRRPSQDLTSETLGLVLDVRTRASRDD